MINVSFLLKKYYRFKSSLQKKLYICPVFNDIDHEWRTSSVRTMSIYNDKNYIDNVINLNLIKKQSKMTKNESKLLSIQGIAKASAFCLLLSAFSVNAAMAAPAPAGTVDEVMAVQQGKKVTGVVVDGTGEPVIGANVVVKGTTNGTITDFDGNYTIEGVPADGVLVISYIGYLSQEIPVGNQSAINVTLKEDTQTLDEVVVVGYGTMRKSDVTGSISTAKGEEMLKAQNFSALDNLRGKAAGVNIFSNSSQPGAYGSRVVIRGQATINASSDPLYVVDGVVMENFYLMNPNDIESMEVLKDASATAIYGARGANGVIMVTTKRGNKEGGTKVSYSGSVSLAHRARKMDTMNAQEWCDAFMQGIENENRWGSDKDGNPFNWSTNRADWFTDRRFFDSNGNPLYDTDWQDEATRTAISHNHQLNVQQGGEKSSMGAFLNYTDNQGIMLNTYSKRLNAKIAYDANPTTWLSTAINLAVNHTWGNSTPEDGGGQDARRTMIEMVPWMPVQYNGKYTSTNTPEGMPMDFEAMSNPVHILKTYKNMNYNTKVFGNAALTFHIIEGLDLKTQFGVDANFKTLHKYMPSDLVNLAYDQHGRAERYHANTLYWQEETYLTYNKTIGEHRINAMAGLSWQERKYDYSRMYTENFTTDFFEDFNMDAGTKPDAPKTYWERWAMNSYFLRFAYTFKDRYSATITGRYDGSSKFGKNNKYAFFPSAGLAWNITQEDFMSDQNTISNLKLHTSYGLTGNSEIGVYKSLATVKSETLLLNGTRNSYSYLNRLPNSDLKWEKTAQFDIGFDLGLFNNRITLDASYYNKKTSDLLLDAPVPHTTGFETVYKNIGSIRNRGLEIAISSTNIRNKHFTWTTDFNISFNRSKVLRIDGENEYYQTSVSGGTNSSVLYRAIVGHSLGEMYGYKTNGVYTTDDFVQNGDKYVLKDGVIYQKGSVKTQYKPGDIKYVNTTGQTDDKGTPVYNSDDMTVIGNANPDFTGGFKNTFSYKGFDLSVFMVFSYGNDIFNMSTQRFVGPYQPYQNMLADAANRFTLLDPRTGKEAMDLNRIAELNPNQHDLNILWSIHNDNRAAITTPLDRFVEDGSYLRISTITLGYTFPKKWLSKAFISNLRLYCTLNNPFTITNYSGYDPEVSKESSILTPGIDDSSYPRSKGFVFGINLSL